MSQLFKQLLASAKAEDAYWIEKAKLDFSVEFYRLFVKSGFSQRQLAEKLNTSAAYITKVFRGDANFTITTMVKLARAVDGEVHIHVCYRRDNSRWFELLQKTEPPMQPGKLWQATQKKHDEHVPTTA